MILETTNLWSAFRIRNSGMVFLAFYKVFYMTELALDVEFKYNGGLIFAKIFEHETKVDLQSIQFENE